MGRTAMTTGGATARTETAGGIVVVLDGVSAGWADNVSGGDPIGDAAVAPLGPDYVVKKHIGGVKYEDITVTCGTGMSKAFYQWMQNTIDGKTLRKSGSIIVLDDNLQVTGMLDFQNALLTEIGLPALDAASKDAAKMTIKIKPESAVRTVNETPMPLPANLKLPPRVQKQWLPANFRLRLDGLEEASARVNKIEAITVKQKVVFQPPLPPQGAAQEPAHLEIPNLVITLPESVSKPFADWYAQSTVQGKAMAGPLKDATLDYLTPDLQQVLFRVTFHGLGIVKLTPAPGGAAINFVTAEMKCESLGFQAMEAVQ